MAVANLEASRRPVSVSTLSFTAQRTYQEAGFVANKIKNLAHDSVFFSNLDCEIAQRLPNGSVIVIVPFLVMRLGLNLGNLGRMFFLV